MSYNIFAQYYDKLTSNIDYHKRALYFNKILSGCNLPGNILLDLACGTGSLSFIFDDLGYDVIGIDSSSDMLNIAMDKKYDLNKDILFLNQSMEQLDLYGTIDVVICALDSINHIIDEDILATAFKKISLFLHPNGAFIFDVNSLYKHEKVLSDNVFVYDYDDIYCVWQNSYYPKKNTTKINLDFFEKQENGQYVRFFEEFYERYYSTEKLEEMLKSAGLKIDCIYADDTFCSPKENSERLIYLVKKAN